MKGSDPLDELAGEDSALTGEDSALTALTPLPPGDDSPVSGEISVELQYWAAVGSELAAEHELLALACAGIAKMAANAAITTIARSADLMSVFLLIEPVSFLFRHGEYQVRWDAGAKIGMELPEMKARQIH